MKNPCSLFVPTVLLIVSIFYFFSCSPVPYANVGQNVPMLKNKGEVSLAGGLASTDDAGGLSIQAAVAVDSSIALMTSFYSLKNNDTNHTWQGRGRYFELGVGKYGVIRPSNFVYDVFVGVGLGAIKNDNGLGSSLNVNFVKPFLQGSLGLSIEWLEFALTSRVAVASYTRHQNELTDPTERSQAEAYFNENESTFVFEPGITLRMGFKSVKLNLNYCTSTFSLDEQYNDASINTNYLGVGLAVLISDRYKQD